MGRQVTVTQPEPIGVGAIGSQFLLGVPRLPASAPAALGVDAVTECVHAGVEVGTDPDPVHPRVVSHVDDCRHLMVGRGATGRENLRERGMSQEFTNTLQKPGATDASDENRHLHREPG